jgi:aspartyl-tRNA(Asn)/glutamyl-tRNA(Gln) amidotransferase subunit A
MTKGIRTTCHSAVLEHWVPEIDATTVTKLKESGAVLLGKLGMHEFAFGGPSVDAPFPAVRNPWNTAHIPGGSSSGSGAALAAGLCYGALGSDTGGSIRTPSSTAASSVSNRPTAASAAAAWSRSAGPSITPDRWRAR